MYWFHVFIYSCCVCTISLGQIKASFLVGYTKFQDCIYGFETRDQYYNHFVVDMALDNAGPVYCE